MNGRVHPSTDLSCEEALPRDGLKKKTSNVKVKARKFPISGLEQKSEKE